MINTAKKLENLTLGTNDGAEDSRNQSVLDDLRFFIKQAASDAPELTVFISRLADNHIEFKANVTKTGRVGAISYHVGRHSAKGSELGPEFTWTGIQKKLGVRYTRDKDFKLLAAEYELPQQKASKIAEPTSEQRDDELRNSVQQQLQKVEELEQRLVGAFSRLHEEEVCQLQLEFERLRREATDGLASEFRKLKDDELQSLTATIAPLGYTVDAVQKDTREILKNIEEERRLMTDGKVEEGKVVVEQILDVTDKLSASTQQALTESQKSIENIDAATRRLRQDSLWLALTSAFIAGLISALVTGLWVSQDIKGQITEVKQEIIEHMDKHVADDPLRAYFDRLMNKLDRPRR